MSELQITLSIILGAVAGVLVILLLILPYLKKKGINPTAIVKEVENKGEIAEKIADILKPLLPKNVTSAIDLIEKWGPIACGYAEQICHAGDIEKSDRAIVAENVVLNVLKQYNITPSDDEKALIDVTIKNAVNALGHDNTSSIKSAGIAYTSNLTAEVKGSTPVGEINTPENVAPVENQVQVKPVEEVKAAVNDAPVNVASDTTVIAENQTVAENATIQTEAISSEEALKQIHEIVSKIAPTA